MRSSNPIPCASNSVELPAKLFAAARISVELRRIQRELISGENLHCRSRASETDNYHGDDNHSLREEIFRPTAFSFDPPNRC